MIQKIITQFILVCLACTNFLIGQVRNQNLDKTFTDYAMVYLDAKGIKSQLSTDQRSTSLQLLGYDLQLSESNIISDHYILRVQGEDGLTAMASSKPRAMNGYTSQGGRVSLTFNDHFVYGFIVDGNETFFIEPVAHFDPAYRNQDAYVLYNSKFIKEGEAKRCGVKEMHDKTPAIEQEANRVGNCYEIEYAIANDFLMHQKYGSITAVENHAIGVTNNVQTNYDDEFADELLFNIVEQFVSTCSTCDPWTNSTDAETLLDDFVDWGPGGFFSTHDIGSLWTDRNFDGSTIGIAYVGVVCTWLRYNCLEDFSNNAALKRVMTSHEIGHNFNASHDGAGSPFIMAPSVSNTNTWSTASISKITAHYLSRQCLANCGSSGAVPSSDFSFNIVQHCVPGLVAFTDQSTGTITSWSWSFPGGVPATSTLQNPTVTYASPGFYSATLTVTNNFGSNTSSINNAIHIEGPPVVDFTSFINGSTAFFTYTGTQDAQNTFSWDFGDGSSSTLENPSHTYLLDGNYQVFLAVNNECGSGYVVDVVNIATPPVSNFTAFPISGCTPHFVQFESQASPNTISWNWTFPGGNPGTSTMQNPTVTYETPGSYGVTLMVSNPQGSNTKTINNYINVSASPTSSFTHAQSGLTFTFTNTSTNATSYIWNFGDGITSTLVNPTHTYSLPGSYVVTLSADNANCIPVVSTQNLIASTLPMALAEATSPLTGCLPLTVSFQSNSLNNPTSILWLFEGGIPGTSSLNNPTVLYNQEGQYDVILIVSNSLGEDTLTLSEYVTVQGPPTAVIGNSQSGVSLTLTNQSLGANSIIWTFPDGTTSSQDNITYIFTQNGHYTFGLGVSNDCGTDTELFSVDINLFPQAIVTSSTQIGCEPNQTLQFSAVEVPGGTYHWVFEGGNPSESNLQNPGVVFASTGSYNVGLVVTNPYGVDQVLLTDYITINPLPISLISVSETNALISLDNSSSNANSILWTLPDGSTNSNNHIEFTALENGNYTFVLAAINACGSSTTSYTSVIIGYPVATIASVNSFGCIPLAVEFNALETPNTDYSWIFEGGSPATSNEPHAVVVYETTGVYGVSLTVTNDFGSDTDIQTEYIHAIASPEGDFTMAQSGTGIIDFTSNVQFADTYLWNFGDGTSSSESNPSHDYGRYGEYEVTLIVTNVCGSKTISQKVLVVTSVEDLDILSKISIEPNPVNGLLYVKFQKNYESKIEYALFDVRGNLIDSRRLNGPIDMSLIPAGIYVLRFKSGDEFSYQKVVKY